MYEVKWKLENDKRWAELVVFKCDGSDKDCWLQTLIDFHPSNVFHSLSVACLSLNRIIMFFYFCLSAITSVFCKSEQWIEFDTFQYIQSKNLSSMSMGSLWFWYSSGCYRRSFNATHCQWKWHSINSYFKCIDRREEDMHRCLLMTFLKKCSLR